MTPWRGISGFFLFVIAVTSIADAADMPKVHRPQFVISKTPLRTLGLMISMGPMYDGGDWIYFVGTEPGPYPNPFVFRYSLSKDTTEKGGEWPPELGLVPGPYGPHGPGVLTHEGDIISIRSSSPNPSGPGEVWRVNALNTSDISLLGQVPYVLPSSVPIWDGGKIIYLVGGTRTIPDKEDDIIQFSLATNTGEIVGRLPEAVHRPAVALALDQQEHNVYLFGGDSNRGMSANITRFDAILGQPATTLNVSLYQQTRDSCAVWTGKQAYIIGGYGMFQSPVDSPRGVTRFTPASNQIELVEVDGFPNKIEYHSCVYVERLDRIYIFGAMYDPPVPVMQNRIVYIDLNPGADD